MLVPTIACTLPDLAPGASVVIALTTTIGKAADIPPGTVLHNVATVSATNDVNPQNNTASADTTTEAAPLRNADVQIVKTARQATVTVGSLVTFDMVVKNNGPDDATAVNVSDALPAGVTFVSVTPSVGTCSGTSAITCALGTLHDAGTATIVLVVRTTRVGTVVNTGIVTTSSTDSNPSNNTSTARSNVITGVAHLRLRKVVDKHRAKAGGLLHYRLVLRVSGTVAALDVRVCDAVPAHTTFVSAPGATFDRGTVCWTRPSLKPGSVLRFRVVVRIDRDAPTGRIRNVAVATSSNASRSVGIARTRVTAIKDTGGVGGVTG